MVGSEPSLEQARASGLPNEALGLYTQLDLPLTGKEAPKDLGPRDHEAAAYLWRAGSYRCGITAYLTFFLLGDFINHAGAVRPERFGRLDKLARSFDYTDRFIKRVTNSGRHPSGGLASPEVVRLLRTIQSAHDRVRVPHWMMVHFGFTLLEQLEADLAETDPVMRHHHLRYMARAYRLMGLPFSDDRELMQALARRIEERHARWEPLAASYGWRLLVLGQVMGVSPDQENLAPLMPATVRPLFRERFEAMAPATPARLMATSLSYGASSLRKWRNPSPGPRPTWAPDFASRHPQPT